MSMIRTVTVNGVDLDVDFDGTSFVPAKISGPPEDCYPAEGGEADINGVFLEGHNITSLLSSWTMSRINEELVEFLCSTPEEEFEEPDYAET